MVLNSAEEDLTHNLLFGNASLDANFSASILNAQFYFFMSAEPLQMQDFFDTAPLLTFSAVFSVCLPR